MSDKENAGESGGYDVRIPDAVRSFFIEVEPFIEAFAGPHGLAVLRYDQARNGDTVWAYNVTGRLHGTNVALQIAVDEASAAAGMSNVHAYYWSKAGGDSDEWVALGSREASGPGGLIAVLHETIRQLDAQLFQKKHLLPS